MYGWAANAPGSMASPFGRRGFPAHGGEQLTKDNVALDSPSPAHAQHSRVHHSQDERTTSYAEMGARLPYAFDLMSHQRAHTEHLNAFEWPRGRGTEAPQYGPNVRSHHDVRDERQVPSPFVHHADLYGVPHSAAMHATSERSHTTWQRGRDDIYGPEYDPSGDADDDDDDGDDGHATDTLHTAAHHHRGTAHVYGAGDDYRVHPKYGGSSGSDGSTEVNATAFPGDTMTERAQCDHDGNASIMDAPVPPDACRDRPIEAAPSKAVQMTPEEGEKESVPATAKEPKEQENARKGEGTGPTGPDPQVPESEAPSAKVALESLVDRAAKAHHAHISALDALRDGERILVAERDERIRQADARFRLQMAPLREAVERAEQERSAALSSVSRQYERMCMEIDAHAGLTAEARRTRKDSIKHAFDRFMHSITGQAEHNGHETEHGVESRYKRRNDAQGRQGFEKGEEESVQDGVMHPEIPAHGEREGRVYPPSGGNPLMSLLMHSLLGDMVGAQPNIVRATPGNFAFMGGSGPHAAVNGMPAHIAFMRGGGPHIAVNAAHPGMPSFVRVRMVPMGQQQQQQQPSPWAEPRMQAGGNVHIEEID